MLRKDRLWRYRLYFFRGHNSWLYFPLWFVNLLTIYYVLLLGQLEFLKGIFPNIIVFGVGLVLLYVPMAILIGRWDYKRGPYKTEDVFLASESPIWNEVFTRLNEVKEGIKKLESKLEEETNP